MEVNIDETTDSFKINYYIRRSFAYYLIKEYAKAKEDLTYIINKEINKISIAYLRRGLCNLKL
jgi:hypothetical protein